MSQTNTGSTSGGPPPRGEFILSLLRVPFGRRRQFIVDPLPQMRAVAIPTGLLMMGFGCVVGAIHMQTVRLRDAMSHFDPDIARELKAMTAIDLPMMVGFGVVVVVGVAAIALLESHRSAGAAYSLGTTLEHLAEGRFDERARLRENDYLQSLKGAINGVAERLGERSRLESAALEALATRLEAAKDEAERDDIATELRQLASSRIAQLAN
jgi:hypothetical protein